MAIIPLNYEEGNIVELAVAATTFTKGDMCVFSSGYMTKATAAAGVPIFYIIMEDVTSTATEGDLHRFYRTQNVPIFVVDTSGTPTQAQMGTYMDTVTNAGTIDEDASSDDLFFAEKIVDAGNKKIQGWFKSYTVES